MNVSDDRLTADVRGEIEAEDGVLIIKRIHVLYHVQAPDEARETIERVHQIHAEHCPVYRSIRAAIEITTELAIESRVDGSARCAPGPDHLPRARRDSR